MMQFQTSVPCLFASIIFGLLVTSVSSCHLGYNIIDLQITKDGQYDISCSQKALPICPKVCSWTNQTCEEYATRRHWNKTHLIVTNMTYSYQLKASGYPRNDTGPGSVKSLHRRCCLAENIEATKCNSVIWNAGQTNSKFDVMAHAKSNLKCATNNAYIRDIQQRSGIQRTFNMDICCLKYPKDHDERVACQAPKNGETQAGVEEAAKIALGVSLPLALGIGIPFLICGLWTNNINQDPDCDSFVYVMGPSRYECCQLARDPKNDGTNWVPLSIAQMFGFSQTVCVVCRGLNFLAGPSIPGIEGFFPKF